MRSRRGLAVLVLGLALAPLWGIDGSPEDVPDAVKLDQGAPAPFDGFLLPEATFNEMFDAWALRGKSDRLLGLYRDYLGRVDSLYQLQERERSILEKKAEEATAKVEELNRELASRDNRIRRLTVGVIVGASVSLAVLAGVGVFASLQGSS